MPLTKSGEKIKRKMKKSYGKKKGERVFYATMNKNKKGTEKRHKETYRMGRHLMVS